MPCIQLTTDRLPFDLQHSRDEGSPKRTPPLVRVRLSVDYRVHSRQMLCVGGSHVPFGWSFLSIAKVPMSWNPEDIWAVEVELPAGTRVEYKYVILEEQDWTQQVNEDVEGKVEYTYRTSPQSSPPDVQHIVRQMAIVAWQPGPNRILQVPAEDELNQLEEGIILERLTPPPQSTAPGTLRRYGQQAVGKILNNTPFPPPSEASGPPRIEEVNGVWERLYIDDNGRPCMDRRDVWGKEPEPLGSDKRGGAK